MSEQAENREVFRRLFHEGFSGGNTAVVDELISPDLKEHQVSAAESREGVKRLIQSLHATFPDFSCEPEEIAAIGDKVWGRVKGGGTDLGGFRGHPPTGKAVTVNSMELCRFERGKIVEHWGITDMLGLLTQLDLIPRPPEGKRN